MTDKILRELDIAYRLDRYEDGKALLESIRRGARFHVLLLDVMMDELGGMEIAARLKELERKMSVIFISINREMALRGYEVSAVRYLAKPLDYEKLKEALIHCCKNWLEEKEILLPTARGQYRTSFSEIQFVEAFERGTRFVLADETVESRLKFGEVETMLPKSAFILCHRAFLTNLSCVKFIRPYEFVLKSGQIVPIGKGRYSDIYKKFVDYLAD